MTNDLTGSVIEQIVRRIFTDRRTTLEAEAQPFDVQTLRATIADLRKSMAETIPKLPEAAFDVGEDSPPGEAGWSAGQIVSHNADRLIWVARQAVSLLHDARLEVPAGLESMARTQPLPLSRDESFAALEQANVLLTDLFARLGDSDTSETMVTDHFGPMGVKGWLLLLAIHDFDHSRQLLNWQEQESNLQ